ncbi:MAG: acyl-CoA thioesterase [Gammaproteobacteria bacterium]|jgi:acyl-CoA thioesterase YciA|nr:acyl-CoA thioesterase [Gammaproteobacteria bacterium]|tara:strand:- start:751 stop:1140 length:390 start_codon:yes stop_codon:yes gene_type:complete
MRLTETQNSPPDREPTVRSVPMPADVNANGDIFGGWVMSQMDIAGGVLASEIANGRVVTVAVEAMRFLKPIAVGDLVSLYTTVNRKGTTSISIHIETWARRRVKSEMVLVTEGTYVYVAIDRLGKPREF